MPFPLFALPHDLMLAVLQQPSIGARELCRLERCSKTVAKYIDENVWREAFLTSRRCNALAEPDSWKQEFARRLTWSRDWRQLTSGHVPLLQPRLVLCGHTSAPQKLRRFALKMMSSTQLIIPARVETHIVDATSSIPGHFRTIGAAVIFSKPYDVILVRPGRYEERIKLEKPVEISGAGPPGSTLLVGFEGPAIEACGRLVARVSNLQIEQQSRGGSPAMSGAVLVKAGATLVLEECAVSSETGHCVVVQGMDSCGYILHNVISGGKGVGVLMCDYGRGLIEDNEICFNGRAGIAILSGADPHVCRNKIHSGGDSGVLISEKGKGRIEENDIFGNRRAGVAILKEGSPLVKRNKIHDGRDSGVLVCEDGHGNVCDNEIFANQMAGVAIGRGGASRVTGNTISDGNGGSLCLSIHSKGYIWANLIHQDPGSAMQVPEALLCEVQQKNFIRFCASKALVDESVTLCDSMDID